MFSFCWTNQYPQCKTYYINYVLLSFKHILRLVYFAMLSQITHYPYSHNVTLYLNPRKGPTR